MTYHRYSARNGGSINLANLERREDQIGSERRSKRKLTCTKMSSITATKLDGVGNRQNEERSENTYENRVANPTHISPLNLTCCRMGAIV